MRARLAATLLALVAVCGCAWLPGDEDVANVTVAVTADRTDLVITVPAKGYLEATQASPVAVPRVPTGALKVKDLVPEGSIIEPGQVVVVFDDTQLSLDLENHESSFRSANRRIDGNDLRAAIESGSLEVMREVAALELDNAESFAIVDEEIFSRVEILETEVRRDDAEATIVFADASMLLRGEFYDIEEAILEVEKTQLEGKMGRVQTSLGNLVLRAPIGGMIVYRKNWRGASVAVGDSLWPGNVIMSIVDPASAALTAFVLERDAAGLQVGAEATIVIDARPDREFRAEVTQVAELSRPIESGSPVKYTEVKIELVAGDPELLKPGMKGEARIVMDRVDDAVVVPRSAVRGEEDERFVLVGSALKPERRDVTLGPGDLVRVSISEGLTGGETVLLGGDDGTVDPDADAPSTAAVSAGI